MLTVNAYAAPSATEPLVPTTIERRDVGPQDVLIEIALRGHLPLRHPHRPRRMGADHLPAGRRPRDRRRRRRGRLRGHRAPGRRPRRRRLHGRTPAASASTASRARSSTASRATSRPTTASMRRHDHPGRLLAGTIVVDEDFVLRVPSRIALEKAAPLLCAGITRTRRSRTGTPAPARRSPIVGWAGSATWASRSRTRSAPRSPCSRSTLSKEDDGLALGADHYYATSDPDDVRAARRTVRPDHQHRQRGARHRRVPRPAAPRRHAGERRRSRREPCRSHVFTLFAGRRSFAGSGIGGIRETQEMLDFCAEHDIARRDRD